MSLRTFHLIFILTVLAVLVGLGWMLGNSEAVDEGQRPLYSWICYGFAILLTPYLGWFFWKTRHLDDARNSR